MAIIRVKKNGNFTIMSNVHLRDKRLSWKAKGLLSYILSLPDDWELYQKELVNHSSDGLQSTRTAFNQLVELGYITKHQHRNEEGKFGDVEYTVFEHGNTEMRKTEIGKPEIGKTHTTKDLNILNTDSNKDLFTISDEIAYIYFNNLEYDLVKQVNEMLETGRSKIKESNYYKASDVIKAFVADNTKAELYRIIDEYAEEKVTGRSVEDFIKRIYRDDTEYYNRYER